MSANDKRKERRQKELMELGRKAKQVQEQIDAERDKNKRLVLQVQQLTDQIADCQETRIALGHAEEAIDTLREKLQTAQDDALKARMDYMELLDLVEKYRDRIESTERLESENRKLRRRLQKRSVELDETRAKLNRLKRDEAPC